VPRPRFDEDTSAPPAQDTEELRKYSRVVMHVMQCVITQQVAKDTRFEGHGMPIAVREAQQALINTGIRLHPLLQAGLQITVDVERYSLEPHPDTEL